LQNETRETQRKGSWDALKQLVEDVQPDVLILDPLSSTHSLQENGIEIKQAHNKADKLIDEYGCAVIIVLHPSPKVPRN
jgi:RecA-family ATPase